METTGEHIEPLSEVVGLGSVRNVVGPRLGGAAELRVVVEKVWIEELDGITRLEVEELASLVEVAGSATVVEGMGAALAELTGGEGLAPLTATIALLEPSIEPRMVPPGTTSGPGRVGYVVDLPQTLKLMALSVG